MPQSIVRQLERLHADLLPVPDYTIELRGAGPEQVHFTVGSGPIHTLLAMESQSQYLQDFASRLDAGDGRREVLLGDRRSGTSWAGLVGAVSLMVANRCDGCVFANRHLIDDTHRLVRSIIPSAWLDDEAPNQGYYRLPGQTKLHIVDYARPTTWPGTCGVVMLNDYAYAAPKRIEAVLAIGQVQIVTGNPPQEREPGRAWILRERDKSRARGLLYRFDAARNQSLQGDVTFSKKLAKLLSPNSDPDAFWENTGL